jgi:hypothetical protein
MMTLGGEPLGKVSPRQLTGARLLLHHAAQLVAAVGRCLVAPRPDDGHTSLEWRAEARALAGQEVPGPRPWRAALRPDGLALAVLARDAEVGRLPLSGRTRAEAFAWIVDRAGALGAPVRVWPHHVDVGSVLPLGGGHGEGAASIGVGLSPGDEAIAEPYFYVTPWPPPPADSLPELPAGGRWRREGWTGAVLTGSEIVAAGGGAAQAAEASTFLDGTVEALRAGYQRSTS